MSNYTVRDNFKDIFGVYFLESLSFEGDYDMPVVGNFDDISVIDYIALYSDTSEYNKTENTCLAFYQSLLSIHQGTFFYFPYHGFDRALL